MENPKKELCVLASKALLFIGALLLGFCGYYVARPNFYGHKFEEKECNITSTYLATEYQSCSCGRRCSSVYPCITVTVNIVNVFITCV